MPIQVKLYGDLRKKVQQPIHDGGTPNILNIERDGIETVFDILKELIIKDTEISHIFVNGKYCGPGKKVRDGDRVCLFPRNMGLMFIEIPKNNSILITIKFFADLRKFGPIKAVIDLPEGSTIKSVLKKYKIPKEVEKLIILINGKPCYENDLVLNNGDIVAIFPQIAGG